MSALAAGAAAGGGLPWVVADIGGTNARFGWVTDPAGPVTHVRKLSVAAHATPAAAMREYLSGLPADAGSRRPGKAAFAVATAITGDEVAMTNSHWRFSRVALEHELGLSTLLVLNDFEALALSLPRLGPDQLRAHGTLPAAAGTLAVVGPGTGLGVATVVQTARGWLAVPGEGGHATLAPADDVDSQILALVRRQYAHVSAERLLSGIGLPVLHDAVCAVAGLPATRRSSSEIVECGIDGSDDGCVRTLDSFCALLGSFAGNVALTVGARGGVFIGGGIVPRLGDAFFRSRFRERFEAKGRFHGYLAAIPTALITDTLAALDGAAMALTQAP